MSYDQCLVAQEQILRAATEWTPPLDGWGIFQVVEGLGYAIHGKSAIELCPGFLIAESQARGLRFRASQLGNMALRCLSFAPGQLSGLLTAAENQRLEMLASQIPAWRGFYDASRGEARKFAEMLGRLPATPNFLGRAMAVEAIACVLREPMESAAARLETQEPDQFRLVMSQLTERDLLEYSVAELARKCGCTPRHFSRLCRQHFGCCMREKIRQSRLNTAKNLLRSTRQKIVNVAFESGFQNLGLFNTIFKKYVGVTPSEWRQQKEPNRAPKGRFLAVAFLSGLFSLASSRAGEPVPPPGPPATAASGSPAAATNQVAKAGPGAKKTFQVKGFDVAGNTLLRPQEIESVVTNFVGDQVTIEQINVARDTLNLFYRKKGYVTVAVNVPPQRSTNGIIKLEVTEGRLAEINVAGNRYFSTRNVLRALPSLRTNLLLNSQWFGPELDRANTSGDRQIYPQIMPGAEPGTAALMLKVKDRLPLHGKLELNNQSTPGTPNLRINSALTYNNLWQLEHSVGVQYGFTPEEFKTAPMPPEHFYDYPLISYYSGYYRLPLGKPGALEESFSDRPTSFGYNETTRQFQLPPMTGQPELTAYASRSSMDTGIKQTPRKLFAKTSYTSMYSYESGEDLTQSENLGLRFIRPLPEFAKIRSSLSAGFDYKYYHLESFNTNHFFTHSEIPNPVSTNLPPTILEDELATPQPVRSHSIYYLPFNVRWDARLPDRQGATTFALGQTFHFAGLLTDQKDFEALTGSPESSGTFVVVNGDLAREQSLGGGWSILARASGQWASEPLISNEQFGIGGMAGVRGYHEGSQYGDHGWRAIVEPQTPLWDLGMVDSKAPMRGRISVFTDYGQSCRAEAPAGTSPEDLWGAGVAFFSTIGHTLDLRLTLAWALLDAGTTKAGQGMAHFSVGAQF